MFLINSYIIGSGTTTPTESLAQHYKETDAGTTGPDNFTVYRYPSWIYLPSGYDENTGTTYGLMVFLSGTGAKGTDLDIMITVDAPTMTSEIGTDDAGHPDTGSSSFWESAQMICMTPQLASGDGDWWGNRISEYLTYAIANFRVDPSKLYVTGLSLGAIYPFQMLFRTMYEYEISNYENLRGVFLTAGSNANAGGENPKNAVDSGVHARAWVGENDSTYYGPTTGYIAALNAVEADYAEINIISRRLDYDNGSTGNTFVLHEILDWSSGTGELLRITDNGTTGTMWVTLDTGSVPADNDAVTGLTSGATCDVQGTPSQVGHHPDAWGVSYTDYSSESMYYSPINDISIPYITGVTLSSGSTTGITITASTVSFNVGIGTSGGTHIYEWWRHDNAAWSETGITGETGSTYTLAAADVGHRVAAGIRPVNDLGHIGAMQYSVATDVVT